MGEGSLGSGAGCRNDKILSAKADRSSVSDLLSMTAAAERGAVILKSAACTAAGVLVLEELENKTINATDERLFSVRVRDPDVLSYKHSVCRIVVTIDQLDRLEVVEVQR